MKYERIKYPDGQISAKILEIGETNILHIAERINSYEDLIYVKSIAEAASQPGLVPPTLTLFIPCLFGQRSDRRFSPNQSFDLKIIADIINSCRFSWVNIFDPHSDVALALIDSCTKDDSYNFVEQAVTDILKQAGNGRANLILVSPDAGAYKKVFSYGEKLNLPVVASVKHRDLAGNIDLRFMGEVKGKDCLIVDDLCDGGATFIALSKTLKGRGARRVYLYVSHGYFSKGFDELYKHIDHIYCTNSVRDLGKGIWEHFTINHYEEPFKTENGGFESKKVLDYVTQYKII
jgi:ribose-phosphate pyrophosphokinase